MNTGDLMRQPPHRRYQPEYMDTFKVETPEESRLWALQRKFDHCGTGERGARHRRKYARLIQAMRDKYGL